MSQLKVSQAIDRCAEIKKQIAELEKEKSELENKIKKYMQGTKRKKIQSGTMSVQFVQVDKLIYSIENMRASLTKQMLKKLTDKKYSVDGAALGEFLQDNPQLKSVLGKVISVEYVPNKNKIEKAFSENQLSEKDVLKFASINSSLYLKYKENE